MATVSELVVMYGEGAVRRGCAAWWRAYLFDKPRGDYHIRDNKNAPRDRFGQIHHDITLALTEEPDRGFHHEICVCIANRYNLLR